MRLFKCKFWTNRTWVYCLGFIMLHCRLA